jgi:hypothetical protein
MLGLLSFVELEFPFSLIIGAGFVLGSCGAMSMATWFLSRLKKRTRLENVALAACASYLLLFLGVFLLGVLRR